MWIQAVTPERIADLFHNYEHALGGLGKGSESGFPVGGEQRTNQPVRARAGRWAVKSRKHFAQPGQAEWGF
jgi:hypothetical protein